MPFVQYILTILSYLKIKKRGLGESEVDSDLPMTNIPKDTGTQEEHVTLMMINPSSETETPQSENPAPAQTRRSFYVCLFILCAIPVVGLFVALGLGVAEIFPKEPPHFPKPRIINGTNAAEKEYPHQILLLYHKTPVCSGSLYKSNIVITAAHCFDRSRIPQDYSIRAGEYDTDTPSKNEQIRSLLDIVIHDEYDSFTVENDIAILKLFDHLEMTDYVKDISLADDEVAPGTYVTIIGWGVTDFEKGFTSNILQKAEIPIVSLKDCVKVYGDNVKSDGSMMCAGFYMGGRDACQGDSGGPLLIENPRTLVGIISWGHFCGRDYFFGVYTNIPFFRKWITEVTEKWEE